jgi:hypothetical protein
MALDGYDTDCLDIPYTSLYTPINLINRTIMLRERLPTDISEFLRYLATHEEVENGIPSLKKLSGELGVSLASLRERRAYSFTPAVRQSLSYALALNNEHFRKYAELRNHVESAFWHQAVCRLTDEDRQELQALLASAWEKLRGTPTRVPHEEHRALHLKIYSRLENPFVTGLLEAYWDAYEAVGLNVFAGGFEYLQEVWQYHQQMVDSICDGNFEAGYQALIAHTDLLYHRT